MIKLGRGLEVSKYNPGNEVAQNSDPDCQATQILLFNYGYIMDKIRSTRQRERNMFIKVRLAHGAFIGER